LPAALRRAQMNRDAVPMPITRADPLARPTHASEYYLHPKWGQI
jgi:hypothetical protein